MTVDDLFPPAPLPCVVCDADEPHRHIWDHQRQFLESPEKYVALIGGYGAGKSLPASILGHLLSVTVPGNRGVIIRRSYPKLHDSIQRIFLEVVARAQVDVKFRENRDGWPHRLIYPNGSEVFFRDSSDPAKFLGPEYGWFEIDEAIEEPERTFQDLSGRLRLPAARRYYKGLLTSNPPDRTHWIAKYFGLETGVKTVGVSGYRLIRAATSANKALPPAYEADLRALLSPSEVRRVLDGEYGFPYEGKPVYSPPFEHGVHVGEPPVLLNADKVPRGLVRGWDFGYHAPCVLWSQIARCYDLRLHWFIHDEYTPTNVEAEELATAVLAQSAKRFGRPAYEYPADFQDVGDAQGMAYSDSGPGPIIRLAQAPYRLKIRYRKIAEIEPGVDLIRQVLRVRPGEDKAHARFCRCGHPVFQVHRRCHGVINMLAGGYHYPTSKHGRETSPKPAKDGFYDNIADALRYTGEHIWRPQMILGGYAIPQPVDPRTLWKSPATPDRMVEFPYDALRDARAFAAQKLFDVSGGANRG